MDMVISNHFLCKDWVHHPIDSQPGFQVRVQDFPYNPMSFGDGIGTINPTSFSGGVGGFLGTYQTQHKHHDIATIHRYYCYYAKDWTKLLLLLAQLLTNNIIIYKSKGNIDRDNNK